jgi:type IV pilus assembly protein PilC
MDFAYIAYTEDKKLVRGKLSASSEQMATQMLSYGGYRVVSLKEVVRFFNKEKFLSHFTRIKTAEIAMFSRQLALLLESGTDIVTSLDLLQEQIDNQILKNILAEVASDIRSGSPLSQALSKHPRAFSQMYYRSISAGEQGGNLEVVLRQMADYIEKSVITQKQIKGALTYPIIVIVAAIVVIGVLVAFVFPTFASLYAQFGVELPLTTRILIAITDWTGQYGLYVLLGLLIAVVLVYIYIRTPAGKYQWDKLMLNMPVFGRIVHLGELSRSCRTMAMLVRIGLPLPEVMAMTVYNSGNKVVVENLSGVQQELIRGEGLSRPMGKRALFLPLMTQMVRVGEETGNLENTLITVADNFEMEGSDKTRAAVALIQPVVTIVLGLVILFLVVSMFSALYSIYGQIG